jgi:hypothetical protein
MRGALHLLTPEDAGTFLSLMAAGRSWERPSWQRYFGMTTQRMAALREAVREALDGATLTREELVEKVTATRGLRRIGQELASGWGTLLKPLAWQGDLCFGPSRGNRVTFMRPEAASPRWAGVPDADAAAPAAMAAYLGAYGPATVESFGGWLAGGWFGKRQLRSWFAELGDRMVEVDVDGERAYVMAVDLDAVMASRPSSAVRLLPGFDQYVLGPGTGDGRVTPAARRPSVSRQSGWIAPVVMAGGVVRGTWDLNGDRVRIAWFEEAGRPPRTALTAETHRLAGLLDRELEASIDVA